MHDGAKPFRLTVERSIGPGQNVHRHRDQHVEEAELRHRPRDGREARTIDATRNAGLIFLDPDNGLEIPSTPWPNTCLEEQLRKTWITDSVLCSAPEEVARSPADLSPEGPR